MLTSSGQGKTEVKRAQEEAQGGDRRSRSQAVAAARRQELGPDALGIVFVHGIGSQLRGATLLDWSAPMVRAVSRWAQTADGVEQADVTDRVIRSEIDFQGDNIPFVTLRVPPVVRNGKTEFEGQTWVLTEAWWAQRLAPAPLSTIVDWCGRQGAVARIVRRIIGHLGSSGRLYPILERLGFGLFVSFIVSVFLLLYGLARGLAAIIPIQSIRDALTQFQLDTFLTTWWGDAYLLLRDPVQSANVRGRLASTISALRDYGCERIAIVAHSGGTIVAYTTLSDPDLTERADTLITHGEVIKMGRELEDSLSRDGAVPPSVRLQRQPLRLGSTGRPPRWIDIWATHDPAPCGRLRPEFGIDDEGVVDRYDFPGDANRSIKIWNHMSLLDDHGTYWDNDEEYVYPVLEQLEVAGTDATRSRFSRADIPPAVQGVPGAPDAPAHKTDDGSVTRDEKHDSWAPGWTTLRRQRVHMLTLWVRMMFVIPLLAAVAEFALPGRSLIDELRDVANVVLGLVPFGTQITDALTSIRFFTPLHEVLIGLGLLEIGVIVVIAYIHGLLPIGQAEIWRPGSLERAAVVLLDVALPIVSLVLLGLALPLFARFVQERELDTPIGPSAVLLPALILVGLAVAILARGGDLMATRFLDDHQAVAASLSLLMAGLVFGALAYTVLQLPEVRTWVVGAAAAFVGFQLLGAIGRWRWRVWDEREREAFRAADRRPYDRSWPAVQIALLSGLAGFAAIVVVFGLADAVPWLLGAVLGVIGIALLRDAALAATPVGDEAGKRSTTETGRRAGERAKEAGRA